MTLRKRIGKLFVIIVTTVSIASFLTAQPSTTGILSGLIKDSDNNPIAGATVLLEGPSLLGMIIFVTNENGTFHFGNIPPGEGYSLHIEKPEHQTKKYVNLNIDIGEEIRISVVLEKDSEESTEVIGDKLPAIDTRASNTAVRYSSDLIQSLPLHKDLFDVLNSIPGAVPENPRIRRGSNISGGSVRGNRFLLEGIALDDPMSSYPEINVSIDTYEEIEMGIAGHSPELTNVDGGYVNIVTKSGGDRFTVGLLAEYYDKSMQTSFLNTDDLDLLGLTKPAEFNTWRDLSFHLGGPVARDVVNMYINGRYSNWVKDFNHLDWSETQEEGQEVYARLDAPHQEYNLFGKVTTHLPLDINASITYNLSSVSEKYDINQIQKYLDQTATNKRKGEISHIFSVQGDYTAKPSLFFEGRVTYSYRKVPLPYSEDALADEPRTYDRYFNMYGNNPEFQQISAVQKLNPSVKGTLFSDTFLGAEHKFKFGLEYEWNHLKWDFWRENPFYFDYYKGDIYSYPTESFPNRGRIYAYTCGSLEGGSILESETHRIGGFLQESLTIARRLTINLGARVDFSMSLFPLGYKLGSYDTYEIFDVLPGVETQYGYVSLGSLDVMNWFDISPHLGIVFDVFGNGTSSISASYSRYHESMALRYFNRVSPLYPQLSSWYWIDTDYDQEPDADDTYTLIDAAENPSSVHKSNRLDPDAKSPITDEYSFGLEHAVSTNLTVGATFIYKHKKNILDCVNDYGMGAEEAWKGYSTDSPYWEKFEFTDPGDDGIFGTGDDLSSYCYVELDESPGGRNWYYTNIESAYRKYTALQLVLNKRMSHRWQFLASLVWSKAWGNIGGWDSAAGTSLFYFDTPNSMVYADGRLDFDRPLNVKIQASVILPYGFDLGGYYNYRSGIPWNRTVSVYVPEDDRYLDPGACYTVATEERASRRTPALSTLDFRLQKKFKLTDTLSLNAYLDVLNALGGSCYYINSNPGGYVDYRDPDNPTFERYGDNISYGTYNNRVFKIGIHLYF